MSSRGLGWLSVAAFRHAINDATVRRAFNTFGEDPLLTAEMGAAAIRGIQSQGVLSMVKHYINFDGANNVTVDPQTLHEIYLKPFETAVHAGVAAVMCFYNVSTMPRRVATPAP